jgi:hypothetical protein
MLCRIVVVPFTPDVIDVGDLGLLVLLVIVVGAIAWAIHTPVAPLRMVWACSRHPRARIATAAASNRRAPWRPFREKVGRHTAASRAADTSI